MTHLNHVGSWTEARTGQTFARENPAKPSVIVGEFQESGEEDVETAVKVALASQPAWASLSPVARGEVLARTAAILRERSQDIGADLTAEEGKPLKEAIGELHRSADLFDYIASTGRQPIGQRFASANPGVSMHTVSRPLGIVSTITPFNFPAFVACFKVAPALMAGNALIWKPSPLTPLTGIRITEALLDAGVPPGVITYLTGSEPELGQRLVAHPAVAAVSFTGSTHVGRAVEVAAARAGKRSQIEMGGHNRLVVLADADLDAAAGAVVEGAFGGTGQKCTSTALVVVEDRVAEELISRVLQRTRELRVGLPEDQATDIGPLVSRSSVANVREAIDDATSGGAKIETGGDSSPSDDSVSGYFHELTVLTGVTPAMRIGHEEVFGPIVGVLCVDTAEEALRVANQSDLGLSASIYTRSLHWATQFTNSMRAGVVHVNSPTTGFEPQAPFGGIKGSGSGPKELGPNALAFYSEESTVVADAAMGP